MKPAPPVINTFMAPNTSSPVQRPKTENNARSAERERSYSASN